jgi:hypothetical protein
MLIKRCCIEQEGMFSNWSSDDSRGFSALVVFEISVSLL